MTYFLTTDYAIKSKILKEELNDDDNEVRDHEKRGFKLKPIKGTSIISEKIHLTKRY